MSDNAPSRTEETYASLQERLVSPTTGLNEKFRTLFTLKNLGGERAVSAMAAGFCDPSALLRHEIAYCLGQLQEPSSVDVLTKLLGTKDENCMVRHEAAEALGALGLADNAQILREYLQDHMPEVRETCELALGRLEWLQSQEALNKDIGASSQFTSVDPAPACGTKDVPTLATMLDDEKLPLFDRYRAMFALRDDGSPDAVRALSQSLVSMNSALGRHEIAFIMGQMQDPLAFESLEKTLRNEKEHGMVRHEAAEALGAIASEKVVPLLQEFKADKEQVVAESCVVALDIADYYTSGTFQYADGLQQITA